MIKIILGKGNQTAIEVRAGNEIRVPPGGINLCVWFRGLERDKLSLKQALIMIGKIWRGEIIPWEVILEVDATKELVAALQEGEKIAEAELKELPESPGNAPGNDGEPI